MWKRNVAIGLTVMLTALTVCLSVVNMKQQNRIDALEAVRNTTTEQVETEIQRYLNNNAFEIFGEVTNENGVDMESLVNDSIGEVIEKTDEGYLVSVKLTEEQSSNIASEVASLAYKNLTDEVLKGKSTIDTEKMKKEIASAVTTQLATYLDSQDKEYVTIEGDTNAIVAQVVAELRSSGVGVSQNTTTTPTSSTPAMTQAQIEALVRDIVSKSSVTSESVDSYKNILTKEVITQLQNYNMIKQGKDGKDGVNGKDGKDGKDATSPVYGVDYFTPEEQEQLSNNIQESVKTQLANEGLSVYGARGYGISTASVDENTGEVIVYTTDSGNTYDSPDDMSQEDKDNAKQVSLGNLDGNTIKFLNIRDNRNNTFTLEYFMEYQLTENDNAPVYELVTAADGTITATAVTYSDGSAATTKPTDGKNYAYRYEAGKLTVSTSQIERIVAEAGKEIVSSLENALGGDLANVTETLDSLKQDVDNLNAYLNGGEVNITDGAGNTATTTVNGMLGFTDGVTIGSDGNPVTKTDENGNTVIDYSEGSLGWISQQITGQSGDIDSVIDLAKDVTEVGNLTTSTDAIEITPGSWSTEKEGYYAKEIEINCINKDADFALVGNAEADNVLNNGQDLAASYIKYVKVETKDNNKAVATIYVDKSIAFDSAAKTQKLYIQFKNTGLNNPGTAITNNHSVGNYNYVRQAEFIPQSASNSQALLALEGIAPNESNGQKIVEINTTP